MDALYRTVATVHVIKLHLLGIRLEFAKQFIIRTCEIYHIAHYPTTHGEDKRFLRCIAIEAYLLVEGTHLLRIIHRLDQEAVARSHTVLRIHNLCTSATLIHLMDDQRFAALILHQELSGHRFAEYYILFCSASA